MSLPCIEDINRLHANICRALADPKRILILYALNERPRNVSVLAKDLNIPQPTVSRHLRILRHQSLVATERDGPSVVYHLADDRIISVLNTLEQVMLESTIKRSRLFEALTPAREKDPLPSSGG